MSLFLQNPLSSSTYRIKVYLPNNNAHYIPIGNPKYFLSPNPSNPPSFQSFKNKIFNFPLQKTSFLSHNHHWHIKAYDSSTFSIDEHERPNNKSFNFDALLSVLESLCVFSSVVISVGCIVNWVFFRNQNLGLVALGSKILIWLLAGSVAIGSVIRRRQWKRVCGLPPSGQAYRPGSESGNVIERIEKLEESMRSANTIIRMLSRQLEKLGIRFRVTRKSLKDPISQAAALAQKNSEATRALAMQEEILEKELSEVQKVLLAMQDQQQKQLELILAIAKSGKLLETKQAPSQGLGMHESDSGKSRKPETKQSPRQVDGQQIQAVVRQKGAGNENGLG